MKRVLCLVSAMNAGGAETFLMKLYRRIDRTQYQMDFCVNVKEKGFYDDEITQLGGKIFYVPPKSEGIKTYARGLSKLIRSQQYDRVLRVTSNAFGFLDCAIAKRAGAKKCIVRSSNSADAEGLYAAVVHRIGRLLFSHCVDVRLAPSDLAAEYTFGKHAYQTGKVHILRNGLDLATFAYDEAARQAIRSEFSVGEGELLLGHVGRFMKQKNHPFLIDVFAELHRKHPNAKLLLVGDGEYVDAIQAQAAQENLAQSVIFAGVRSDVPKLMSAMDVLLLPSLYEGMPNVALEAQTSGLPCLLSDTITKEANVTGLVTYLPIDNGTAPWVAAIEDTATYQRAPMTEQMKAHGYDIDAVKDEFVQFCLK